MPRCVFLPDNGAFFVNYVITAAFLGTGMDLLRLGSLFLYSTRLFFSRSEPERVHIRQVRAGPFPEHSPQSFPGRVSVGSTQGPKLGGTVQQGGSILDSRVGRKAASRPELLPSSQGTNKEPQEQPSQETRPPQGNLRLLPQRQAMDFQFGREYAWMSNVFSVVMAYSITCPIIVPFGESSLRHSQDFTPSDWERFLIPTTSGHLLEHEKAQDRLLAGWGGARARARARIAGFRLDGCLLGCLLSECVSE